MHVSRFITLALAMLTLLGAKAQSTYTQLTNLPTLYIETENATPITSKEEYLPAVLHWVDQNGDKVYDALEVRGRGNSTWGLEKKPYRLKFTKKQEFLGSTRAKAKSWTLLANHTDKSLIRNAVAAFIGTQAGQPFTAAAQFVDVYLNGKYLGNYQVSDQMEIRPKRVDIVEQEEDGSTDITGGYFLEVDGFANQEPVYFTTRRGVKITIKSPDDDVIQSDQIQYISNYIQQFEDALFSADFTNAETGYRRFVDTETLISWYVATEFTGNPDAFWSTYIYKNRGDDKIYWGPMWDYDIAFNNCQRKGDISRGLLVNVGYGQDLTGIWVNQMWNDPWFLTQVCRKWNSMMDNGVTDKTIAYVDSLATLIDQSQQQNFKIWSISRRVYDEYRLFSTYTENIQFLKDYIRNRASFLTQSFAAVEPPAPFEADVNYYYGITNVGSGMMLDTDNNIPCIWQSTEGRHTQHWRVIPAATEGTFIIVNRDNGLALKEMSTYEWGKWNTDVNLGFATPDPEDPMQQWDITLLSKDIYAVRNRTTQLGWNNKGGINTNGNPVISWTSDDQNVNKPTRQWTLATVEPTEEFSAITAPEPDYELGFSQSGRVLHFYASEQLEGTVEVYNMAGQLVKSTAIAADISLDNLTAGTYVVAWQLNGFKRHTAKIAL